MTKVDILIVGGGPAGLLAANFLASKHRVALVERGVLGRTTKCWVTTERRLRLHNLCDCILHKAPAMYAGTFLGSNLVIPGDLVVVDDQAFLRVLVERCAEKEVLLLDKCPLLNLAWECDHIRVETSCKSFLTRLVVDASGGQSPVATTFRLHKLEGFLCCHGAHLSPIRLHSPNIVLAYVNQLGDPPPGLEVAPTGPDSAYCMVFVYSRQLIPQHSLASIFERNCRHNPFFDLLPHTKFTLGKVGVVPVGKRRRRSLPGLISLGEAGMVQPPLLGTAFNEILEYNNNICAYISELLKESASLPPSAAYRYPVLKRVQDRIQLTLVRWLMDHNVEAFDRFVRVFSGFPPETAFNFCSNELTWSNFLRTVPQLPLTLLRVAKHSL